VAERFEDAGGDRRTAGALEANLYCEGSATVTVLGRTGARTGAVQEGFIDGGTAGVVLNAPQYIPCGSAPAP